MACADAHHWGLRGQHSLGIGAQWSGLGAGVSRPVCMRGLPSTLPCGKTANEESAIVASLLRLDIFLRCVGT